MMRSMRKGYKAMGRLGVGWTGHCVDSQERTLSPKSMCRLAKEADPSPVTGVTSPG